MPDSITRLNSALEGRYRIERQLGEGGMATVYLARDLKHNRNVALKVLKPELAAVVGADRFLAEIETTANLQHPHILPLFDSGEADSFLFYVMPYVEGESLRERLDREHQLPVDEAVQIAKNLAEALDYAHSRGVIHRDIKPANILLQAGKPVVSDFGIALAIGAAGGGRLTETGLSLGTPHYMSPEQATGDLSVGAGSDIYALGCVLYEMLVGEPPFTGSTPQAVLGKIVTGEAPSAKDERGSVPPNVDSAIQRALEKLPADRFTDGRGFAQALDDKEFRHRQVASASAATAAGVWKPLTIVFAALFGSASAIAVRPLLRPEPPRPVYRFELSFPEGQEPVDFGVSAFVVSPDGSTLIYRGPSERAEHQLWIRRLDELDGAPISGTELGGYPAVSPDGRSVAFQQNASLKVAPLDGGPVIPLNQGIVAHWSPDGRYVYSRVDGVGTMRVPATGGEPEPVTRLQDDELQHVIYGHLSGTEVLLRVTVGDRSEVRAHDVDSGEETVLVNGWFPQATPSGYLTTMGTFSGAGGPLFAAPFDARSLTAGPSVPVIDGVMHYSLSESGVLVYTTRPAGAGRRPVELVWVTRNGDVQPVQDGWEFDRGEGNEYGWRLSPDGGRIALQMSAEGQTGIWIKEVSGGRPRRLNLDEGAQRAPSWHPDGQSVVYLGSDDSGVREPWTHRADFTGLATPLLRGRRFSNVTWSPTSEWLVLTTYYSAGQYAQADLLAYRPEDGRLDSLVATSDYAEWEPAVSPDGRWLAYSANEEGDFEVYVRPFPDIGAGKFRISLDGGRSPRWAHTGRELFFVSGDRLLSASIELEREPRAARIDTLFAIAPGFVTDIGSNFYDVDSDDQRFLMARGLGPDGAEGSPRFVVVLNFDEVLRTRVPK